MEVITFWHAGPLFAQFYDILFFFFRGHPVKRLWGMCHLFRRARAGRHHRQTALPLHLSQRVHRWVVWSKSLLSGTSRRLGAAKVRLRSAVRNWGCLCTLTLSQRCLVRWSDTLSSGTVGHYDTQDSFCCLAKHRWTLDVFLLMLRCWKNHCRRHLLLFPWFLWMLPLPSARPEVDVWKLDSDPDSDVEQDAVLQQVDF